MYTFLWLTKHRSQLHKTQNLQECRERNDELKYWKLTASVKFSGYKFLGYGVTMKIAKAEAAIKALTFLDVLGKYMKGDPFL